MSEPQEGKPVAASRVETTVLIAPNDANHSV